MTITRFLSKRTVKKYQRGLAILAVFAVLFGYAPISTVRAAALTQVKDTLSTVKASTAANHTISFVATSGVSAGQTMAVTFPTGFTMGSVAFGDVDVSDNGSDLTLAGSASGTTWGAAVAGQVLTITSGTGTITAGHTVVIEVGTNATFGTSGTNQVTNSSAGNNKVMSITSGNTTDSGSLALSIISNDVVNITSTVDPSLTFTVDDNTIGFGTLSTSAARYATGDTNGSGTDSVAHTMTIATNAQSGYAVTYNGATLTSGGNTITAATITADADGTPGSEQFAISMTTNGAGTIASGYNHSGPDWKFTAGTTTTVVSSTGSTNTETFSMHYLANIAGNTEAGSYTTNLTYIGTGTF